VLTALGGACCRFCSGSAMLTVTSDKKVFNNPKFD